MAKNIPQLPAGHVLVPTVAIGSLAVLLVAGLGLLGLLDRMNAAVAALMKSGPAFQAAEPLTGWVVWPATLFVAFGLPYAMLGVPGTWRRIILWASLMAVVAGWAPVLMLAARAPDVGGPFIATVWSGVCALVYAANHRMACEIVPRAAAEIPAESPHEAR